MEAEGVKLRRKFYFIDESGDASFFGRDGRILDGTKGYQPYLIIGMVEILNRIKVRNAIVRFMRKMKEDVLYNSIYSMAKDDWFLHAKGDHPEVRIRFFEFLRRLEGFKMHIITARKKESTFEYLQSRSSTAYYFHVLQRLLQSCLHEKACMHNIYLSECGKHGIGELRNAVKGLESEGAKFNLDLVLSSATPELSITDYMLWAVQRKIIQGESRYFDALRSKFEVMVEM